MQWTVIQMVVSLFPNISGLVVLVVIKFDVVEYNDRQEELVGQPKGCGFKSC